MFDAKQPDDIFSAVDKSQPEPVQRPIATPAPVPPPAIAPVTVASPQPTITPTPTAPLTPPANPPLDIMPGHDFGATHRWWVALPILGVVVAVIAGYMLYQRYTPGGDAMNQALSPEPMVNTFDTIPPSEQLTEDGTTEPTADITTPPPADSDLDGLDDATEAQYGTNPSLADSDLDGLFDKEEIQVYRTDPLKADSDGDGYMDGEEVRGGYNPLGPGRLFEVPAQ